MVEASLSLVSIRRVASMQPPGHQAENEFLLKSRKSVQDKTAEFFFGTSQISVGRGMEPIC